MSYKYRSKGSPDQQTERHKQKLNRGILTYCKAIAGISARLTALRSQRDQEIAQAIWDDVTVQTVAAAAGITPVQARTIGLAFEEFPTPAPLPQPIFRLFGPSPRRPVGFRPNRTSYDGCRNNSLSLRLKPDSLTRRGLQPPRA